MLTKWFHHLLNPHCIECAHDKECKTCDTLRDMLEAERFEKKQLLNRILELTAKPTNEVRDVAPKNDFEELRPRKVSWNVKRAMLEEEDRAKARVIAERKLHEQESVKTIEELERELGVANAD
jgi:hypothetical protein